MTPEDGPWTSIRRIFGLLGVAGLSLIACVFGGATAALAASLASSLVICMFYPRHWWPAGAASLVFLVPYSYTSGSATLSYLVPGSLIILAYVLSGLGQRPSWMGQGIAIFIGIFALYCVLQFPFGGSDNNSRKLIWSLLLISVVLLPSLTSRNNSILKPLVLMSMACGLVISTFGIIEYITKVNMFTEFFSLAPSPVTQKWGDYRILTMVGHPLVNATFLAISGTASLSSYLRWNYRPSLLILAMSSVALVFTQSRTGIAALAAGVGLALIGSARGKNRGRIVGAVMLLATAMLIFLQIENPLLQRNSSVEGQGSSELRFAYLEVLPGLMEAASVWGTGAGLSDSALEKVGGYASGYPIESSAIQLLVSLGTVGTLVFVSAVGGVLILSLRRGAFVAPSMFAAYVVAASGFNLFEAFPALIAIPGILLAACIAEACGVSNDVKSSYIPERGLVGSRP
jgi:hypothetical protein